MNKIKQRSSKKTYYQKNREHILFYKREYNLKYRDRHRKFYRNFDIQANMPVDLFMMRNRQKFNEGISLNYE